MVKPRQLNNAAATWLNTYKDALLPTCDELSDLPNTDWVEDGDYTIGKPDHDSE